MKPVFQTKFGKNNGNCFPACIASILELSIEEVPHIMHNKWLSNYNEWIEEKFGMNIYILQFKDKSYKPKGFTIGTGKSPRGKHLHAVVCKDGEIIHDPHPDQANLDSEIQTWTIFGILDPRKVR